MGQNLPTGELRFALSHSLAERLSGLDEREAVSDDRVRGSVPSGAHLGGDLGFKFFGEGEWPHNQCTRCSRKRSMARETCDACGEHWQCGYVIPKGNAAEVRARGIEAFRADVARLLPAAAEGSAWAQWARDCSSIRRRAAASTIEEIEAKTGVVRVC